MTTEFRIRCFQTSGPGEPEFSGRDNGNQGNACIYPAIMTSHGKRLILEAEIYNEIK
jgi:hypothetical protein